MPGSRSFPALHAGLQEEELRTYIAAAETREEGEDGVPWGPERGVRKRESQVHRCGGWSWKMQKMASLL